MQQVTITLPAAEIEAIAAHVCADARVAEADNRPADAAAYYRRAGTLFLAAGILCEADFCLTAAEVLIAGLDGEG